MERNRFEILRERLEEQLRADVELLYEAHRTKMRAFETVWRAQAELDPSLQPPPPPSASSSRQQTAALPPLASEPGKASMEKPPGPKKSLVSLFFEVLNSLPEVFDKQDVHRALGFTPSTSSLHRVINDLIEQKWLRLEEQGTGRVGNKYRRIAMVADNGAEPDEAASR